MGFRITLMIIYALSFAGIAIAAPETHWMNGVPYVSGGVGEDNVTELEQTEADYNLKIVSAMGNGEYSGPYTLVVRDNAKMVVLNLLTEGPLFYAKLPAGTYELDATLEGRHQVRRVSVGAKLQTAHFTWAKIGE